MKMFKSTEKEPLKEGYLIRVELIKFTENTTYYNGKVIKMITLEGHPSEPDLKNKTLGDLLER